MYKGVLRYHLGLIVPGSEGSCRIRVGNDVRCWKEGKSLIFDDSHPHEVWNDCDSYRVVLFVDFVTAGRFSSLSSQPADHLDDRTDAQHQRADGPRSAESSLARKKTNGDDPLICSQDKPLISGSYRY